MNKKQLNEILKKEVNGFSIKGLIIDELLQAHNDAGNPLTEYNKNQRLDDISKGMNIGIDVTILRQLCHLVLNWMLKTKYVNWDI